MFSQKLLSSQLSMAGKNPACGNSSKTDSPSLTQPCVYVAVNFLSQVIFFFVSTSLAYITITKNKGINNNYLR